MALLMSPWMQSSQGAFKSLQRMFFLQSISLKNWKRKESLAALILVIAVYIFSDESASSFREFICFSRSFSIFSQFSPCFGFTLSMKFYLTTSNKDRNSVLAFSQQAQKKRLTSRFLELSELCSLLKFFIFQRETACPLRTFSISPKECFTAARLSMRLVSVSMFFLPFSMVLLIFLSIEVAFFSLPSIVSKYNSKLNHHHASHTITTTKSIKTQLRYLAQLCSLYSMLFELIRSQWFCGSLWFWRMQRQADGNIPQPASITPRWMFIPIARIVLGMSFH